MKQIASYQQYMIAYEGVLETHYELGDGNGLGWEAYTYQCWQHFKASGEDNI